MENAGKTSSPSRNKTAVRMKVVQSRLGVASELGSLEAYEVLSVSSYAVRSTGGPLVSSHKTPDVERQSNS
jgi:hypothetical protein